MKNLNVNQILRQQKAGQRIQKTAPKNNAPAQKIAKVITDPYDSACVHISLKGTVIPKRFPKKERVPGGDHIHKQIFGMFEDFGGVSASVGYEDLQKMKTFKLSKHAKADYYGTRKAA